jgi:hypothetical protein
MADHFTPISATSPVGIAVYPKLTTPDTKFNPDGVYSCRLRVPADKAAPFVAKLDELYQRNLEVTKAKLERAAEESSGIEKGKAKKALAAFKPADKPYKLAVNEEGEETGEVEFNFKLTAKYTERKTGKVRTRRPSIVDYKGTQIDPEDVSIWGGSKVQVGCKLAPFNTAIGCGISLRLVQVRIIKLVSGGDEQFEYEDDEEEDDAFIAPPQKTKEATPGAVADAPDSASEDDEF